jgi:hypothetical protein
MDETTIHCLVIERRNPVIREVLSNHTRRTCRLLGVGIGHLEAKAITSHNGVNMARNLSCGDNGISSLDDEGAIDCQQKVYVDTKFNALPFAREAPVRRCWRCQDCQYGKQGSDHPIDKTGHDNFEVVLVYKNCYG